MSYNNNVPNASQSPGLFPTQGSTNFTRLKTVFNSEHVFNDTAAADDGVHRQMTTVDRSDPSSLPAGTNFIYYSNANQGKMYDGTDTSFIPQMLAAVTFDNTGTTLTSTNIASVVRNSLGVFTVTFTNALPDINGMVLPSSHSATTSSWDSYATDVTTADVILRFFSSGNPADPSLGSLMIFNGQ